MTTTGRGRGRTTSVVVLSNLVALAITLGCGGSKPAQGDGAAGTSDAGSGKAGSSGTAGGGAGSGAAGTGGGGTSGAGSGGGGSGGGGTGGGAAGSSVSDGGAGSDGSSVSDTPVNLPPLKLDGPWLVGDVGELGDGGTARGSLVPSSTVFTIRGTGVGVGGTADGFFFAYQHLVGDGEIVARVQALLKVSPTGQVGVMLRADDIAPGAAGVFLAVDGDGTGGHMHSRLTKGVAATATADATVKEGRLLRLTRTGKVVTAYRDDGAGGWIKLTSVEIDLPADVVVGLAATDGVAGSVASAAFDVARVSSIDSDGATKGWVLSELGTMGSGAAVTGDVVTLAGLGQRTLTTSDVGVFFQQSATGGHTFTAKVTELEGANADTRVGIMMREGSPTAPVAGAAYAFMSVTKGKGAEFGNRSKAGGNAQAGIGMLGVTAPIWLRLEKRDSIDGTTSTFTGFLSNDGTTWNVLDSLTFPLQQPYSLGVFLLSNSVTAFSGARITQISVGDPK